MPPHQTKFSDQTKHTNGNSSFDLFPLASVRAFITRVGFLAEGSCFHSIKPQGSASVLQTKGFHD